MVAAAISATKSSRTPSRQRSPLLPSEKDNGVATPASAPSTARKSKSSKETASRYMAFSHSDTSSSKRFSSPLIARSAAHSAASAPKRSLSAERTPRAANTLPDSRHGNVATLPSKGFYTSCRSLAVSFQGESFSLPISKIKSVPSSPPANSSNMRRVTPETRRSTTPMKGKGGGDPSENNKAVEHQRWPGRIRQSNPITRSLFCDGENLKSGGLKIRALQQSVLAEGNERRTSSHRRINSDLGCCDPGSRALSSPAATQMRVDADLDDRSPKPCNLAASDSESFSSGSNSGSQEFSGAANLRSTPYDNSISACFWQETSACMRRILESGPPLSRTISALKLNTANKTTTQLYNPTSSPLKINREQSSPLRKAVCNPSPGKLKNSPSSQSSSSLRPTRSPTRMQNVSAGPVNIHSSNMPSILTIKADLSRAKGEKRIEDALSLRLLYNRYLQWRFANARAEADLSIQRAFAEKSLHCAYEAKSELQDSVTFKKITLHVYRQNRKLTAVLKGQRILMEDWSLLDRDHINSLLEAIQALKATTLRLPVIDGARAEIQNVKDAVTSAVDMMQALGSSVFSLLSKVRSTNSLATELANVATRERELMSQCENLLSKVAVLLAEECSLRTHLLQLKQQQKLVQL